MKNFVIKHWMSIATAISIAILLVVNAIPFALLMEIGNYPISEVDFKYVICFVAWIMADLAIVRFEMFDRIWRAMDWLADYLTYAKRLKK